MKKILKKQTVLVVDDSETNLTLLQAILHSEYRIQTASTGDKALQIVFSSDPPDIILLDIVMPEMDGYEVCERIMNNLKAKNIPILFVTAKDALEDEAKGFALGAVDYLAKPISPPVLKARIKTHLALSDQNRILEEKVRQKTQELSDANKRLQVLDKAKSDFLALIAHELRTPLGIVFGITDTLFATHPDKSSQEKALAIFLRSKKRFIEILDEALFLTQIKITQKKLHMDPIMVRSVLEQAIQPVEEFATSKGVSIAPLPAFSGKVFADEELLAKAFSALIKTAVKFSHKEHPIRFTCKEEKAWISIVIHAQGLTIPENFLSQFFEVFSIADPITPGGNLGLQPPLAERIIKLLQGKVSVANHEGQGVVFTIKLKKG